MSRFPRVVPFLLSPLLAAAVVASSACSSSQPKFQDDQLLSSAPSPFSRSFGYASTDACEASRRALLSQGYMTTMTRNDTVDATKNFQPASDSHIVVEVHVVCTAGDASNTSMVYVNAVQNGYALKKSDTSASVGLSILGSVSLPIRSNSDSMVKVSSETIQSGRFYERFFDLVGRYLGTVARSEPVPDPGAIKVTPLPPVIEPAIATTMPAVASVAPAASAQRQAPVAAQPALPAAAPGPIGSGTPGAQTASAPPQPAIVHMGATADAAIPAPAAAPTTAPTATTTPPAPAAADHVATSTANAAPTAEPPVLTRSTATLASASGSTSNVATAASAAPANTTTAPATTAPAAP